MLMSCIDFSIWTSESNHLASEKGKESLFFFIVSHYIHWLVQKKYHFNNVNSSHLMRKYVFPFILYSFNVPQFYSHVFSVTKVPKVFVCFCCDCWNVIYLFYFLIGYCLSKGKPLRKYIHYLPTTLLCMFLITNIFSGFENDDFKIIKV